MIQRTHWEDAGTDPSANTAKYIVSEQPVAEYDNWFNSSVVDDVAALDDSLNTLAALIPNITHLLDDHAALAATHAATGAIVGTTVLQTLTNKTLTDPVIASLINANHTHAAAGATGGVLDHANLSGKGNIEFPVGHAAIDTAIGTTIPGLVTAHAALTEAHGASGNLIDQTILDAVVIAGSRVSRDYGFIIGGSNTQKYDDLANTWTAKASVNTTRSGLAAFALNGYGYTAGGYVAAVSAVTEKYDDIANTWTAKTSMSTARRDLSGFSLSRYGYTAGGNTGAVSAVTERYDDLANTWSAKTSMNTARSTSGFSLNGFGYAAGGNTGAASAVTEKFDEAANTWTAKTAMNTARGLLSAFCLEGYGYTAGGTTGAVSAVVEQYDDVANTWTAKTSMGTARSELSGFSQNCFGYTAGGNTGVVSAVTEKYDNVANTWTAKGSLNTACISAGFSLGALQSQSSHQIVSTLINKRARNHTAITPASASAAGEPGEIVWGTSYVYVCVAANTWKRAAIGTWV